MGKTKIGWADYSWNPIQDVVKGVIKQGDRKGEKTWGHHCTKVSAACDRCYAEGMNIRFGNGRPYDGGDVEFEIVPHVFDEVSKWPDDIRIFVMSMGDLFHEKMPHELIDRVMRRMISEPGKTFMLLTKRHRGFDRYALRFVEDYGSWPQNVWGGVTAENEEQFYKRVSVLVGMEMLPVRFMSVEPMLGPVRIPEPATAKYIGKTVPIDWVICGGESGAGARLMDPRWVKDLRNDCTPWSIPFYFKQWGAQEEGNLLDKRKWEQVPASKMESV